MIEYDQVKDVYLVRVRPGPVARGHGEGSKKARK